MTTSNIIYIVSGIIVLFVTLLFVGQFYDPNDGDRTFFIKHKPSLKQIFYSPMAFHRLHPQKLTIDEDTDEIAFREFREDMVDNPFPIIPVLLIQATLSLLITGLYSILSKRTFEGFQITLHYVINLLFTGFGVVYILLADESNITQITAIAIILINILSLRVLEKKKLNYSEIPIPPQ